MKGFTNLIKWLWLVIALMSAYPPFANASNLTRLQVIPLQTQLTRVILSLDNLPVGFKYFQLTHPDRLVIDLTDTALKTAVNYPSQLSSLITAIHTGRGPDPANSKLLRIVFTLATKASLSQQTEPDEEGHGQLLIIDLKAAKATTAEVTTKSNARLKANSNDPAVSKANPPASTEPLSSQQTATANKAPTTMTEQIAVTVPNDYERKAVVVIDPGHGGKDPGATGLQGSREKDIVLAIAKQLQQHLQQYPGVKAILTRQDDYFITLRQRLRLARKDKADMFIAIHADAFNNSASNGVSVFALSASGASSEAARWLAEKENYSELGGVSLQDKGNILRSVLLDLSQTATINLSLQLGANLLQQLGKLCRLHHNGVEQARFVVLKSPDIPSVLVETGFLSNEKEEQRLSDPAYQEQIANSLAQGIIRYFSKNSPPGTIFAVQKEQAKQALAEI